MQILKAKEVAPVIQATASKKSPHSCRRPAVEWRSRSVAAQGREKGVSTSKNMVSLLHGVSYVFRDLSKAVIFPRPTESVAIFVTYQAIIFSMIYQVSNAFMTYQVGCESHDLSSQLRFSLRIKSVMCS